MSGAGGVEAEGGKLPLPEPSSDLWESVDGGASYRVGREEHTEGPLAHLKPSGYVWPTKGLESVCRSFNVHTGIRLASTRDYPPSEEEEVFALGTAAAHNKVRFPFQSAPDWESPELEKDIRKLLRQCEKDSITGLGRFSRYPTIGEAFGWNGIKYEGEENIKLLVAYVREKLRFLATGSGLAGDDVKLFIKDEPTKVRKVEAGRYRLIWAFSVEDQIVDRLLFGDFFQLEIQSFDKVVSKTGWSPLPGGYRYFNAVFTGEVLATDCTCFDWTYPGWVVKLFYKSLLSRCRGVTAEFKKMTAKRFSQVLGEDCVVRLPDGRRYRQREWGLMKSGWLLTLMGNSNAQLLLYAVAWRRVSHLYGGGPLPLLWAMGDDVIMQWNDRWDPSWLAGSLESLGILVKQWTSIREFAGFKVEKDGRVLPLYPDKHRFHLAYHSETELREISVAYGLIYGAAGCDKPDFITDLVRDYSDLTWDYFEAWARGMDVAPRLKAVAFRLLEEVAE